MSKYFRWIRQNIGRIYGVLIMIISTAILIMLFPNIGKFKYEYRKGKPWMHETLIAPYDFAILKTDDALKHEKDSILNQFVPFFKVDMSVYKEVEKKFTADFNAAWSKLEISEPTNEPLEKQKQKEQKITTYEFLLTHLYNYYKEGIGDIQNDQREYDFKVNEYINKLQNNVNVKVKVSAILTPELVYRELISAIKYEFTIPELRGFIQQLNLPSFLKVNLFYDKEMSDKVLEKQLSNISLTQGMVEQGTRIVLVGDIISDKTFIILESLRKDYESILGSSQGHYLIVGGQSILIIVCIILLILYLRNFRKEILYNNKKLLLIFSQVVLFTGLTALVLKFPTVNIYVVPYALITIMIRSLMDSRTSLMVFLVTIIINGFLAPNGFEFVFLQFCAGVMAIYSLPQLQRRGQLVLTSFISFLTYSIVYFAFEITQEGSVKDIDWFNFMWFAINGLLLSFSYSLMYIYEKLFGVISDVTLIELSNQNHPLLRQLIKQAPGTFQHSLQVANLSEAAINKIGGNPLLVRTGAMYHDIGKMKNPGYFIENQLTGKNPHDELDFDKSAQIITDHVKYGIKIAKKHNLPQSIIDFIETHHGSGKVMYFYTSFKNKYPDREIDEEKFTYPGPDPFSKETAVLMMADSVEAASRSLQEKTPDTLIELINKIIDGQVSANRFANTDITFKDITQIKQIFTDALINIYHARIEYPEEKK